MNDLAACEWQSSDRPCHRSVNSEGHIFLLRAQRHQRLAHLYTIPLACMPLLYLQKGLVQIWQVWSIP